MPMGDNAPDFGQGAHVGLGAVSGAKLAFQRPRASLLPLPEDHGVLSGWARSAVQRNFV